MVLHKVGTAMAMHIEGAEKESKGGQTMKQLPQRNQHRWYD